MSVAYVCLVLKALTVHDIHSLEKNIPYLEVKMFGGRSVECAKQIEP